MDATPRYKVLRKLGEGGMGSVYLALDRELERQVALKMLLEELASDPMVVTRFFREARTMAAVSHPNLLGIHDCVADAPKPYLVLEYVEGTTLLELLQRERCLPGVQVLELARELGGALGALHAAGTIHRDIKPANVMIRASGASVLMDLGLAYRAGETVITRTGVALGTPQYMAPEQLVRGEGSRRSDVFQLGAVLFEAAAGQTLLSGASVGELARDLLDGNFRRLPDDPERVPPALRTLIEAAVEPDPEDRPESGAVLAKMAEEALAELGGPDMTLATAPLDRSGVSEDEAGRLAVRPPRRRRGTLLGVAVLAGVLLWWWAGARAPSEIRMDVVGDALRVEWLARGEVDPRLEVDGRIVPGELREDSAGRRVLVVRSLGPDRKLEARLVWEGGSSAPRTLRTGLPAISPRAALVEGPHLKLGVERACAVWWSERPGERFELSPGARTLPPPPDAVDRVTLCWREGGLEHRREWSIPDLLRAAMARLEGELGGLSPGERPDGDAGALPWEAVGRAWAPLVDWMDVAMSSALPLDERVFLWGRWMAWNRARLHDHEDILVGESWPRPRPGQVGSMRWEELPSARSAGRGSHEVQVLEVEERQNSWVLVEGAGRARRRLCWDLTAATLAARRSYEEARLLALHFAWPAPPEEEDGLQLELGLRVEKLPRNALVRIECAQAPERFLELMLHHPRVFGVIGGRFEGDATVLVPREIAPAPGTRMKIWLEHLDTDLDYLRTRVRTKVFEVRTRWVAGQVQGS